jgi:hypothetical protein
VTSGLAFFSREHDTATLLRRGLLGLAVLGAAGTILELVFLRHWNGATQLIVWQGVAALLVALVLLVRSPSAGGVRAARWLALVVVVIAVVGIGLHVNENLDAGPLDRNYAATWDGLTALEQWWLAITGGVGPAPVLAPGALAEIALCLLLATLRHPGLGPARD